MLSSGDIQLQISKLEEKAYILKEQVRGKFWLHLLVEKIP